MRVQRAIDSLKKLKGQSVQMHMDSFFGRPTVVVNPNKKRKVRGHNLRCVVSSGACDRCSRVRRGRRTRSKRLTRVDSGADK